MPLYGKSSLNHMFYKYGCNHQDLGEISTFKNIVINKFFFSSLFFQRNNFDTFFLPLRATFSFVFIFNIATALLCNIDS